MQYELRQAAGHALIPTERTRLQEANEAYKHTTMFEGRTAKVKAGIEQKARNYLDQLSDTVEISYMQALQILRLWPGTTTAYDCMSSQTLLTHGTLPPLLPLKKERRCESFFGIAKGRIGSHARLSRETYDYPYFAKLLALWATTFTQDMLKDNISFTSVSIHHTQHTLRDT